MSRPRRRSSLPDGVIRLAGIRIPVPGILLGLPGILLAAVFLARLSASAPPAGEMPQNTVLLSTMMQQLSTRPGFTDEFLARLAGGGTQAALPLTPELRHDLRELILGRNWTGLDRFPGWTMARLNAVVAAAQKIEGNSSPSPSPGQTPGQTLATYLDLGEYPVTRAGVVSLDQPATGPGFDSAQLVIPLVDGVTTGDGPDLKLTPLHAESTRLAELLNRLAANQLSGAQPVRAQFAGRAFSTPEDLMAALIATGHHVEVDDSRYFANFGSLNWATPENSAYHGASEEIMMPFWIDSELPVPNTGRTLLVPVSHAQYEWHISGPRVNAAVSFWFGIDGKTEFRTMDQVEQRWVMGRHAHVYTGSRAVEVTRLAGRILATYARLHLAHPAMPFGGYYTFGVCQDVVAAIELRMTGQTTLFPNTADNAYFPAHPADPRDGEVNALIRRLPKDGHGNRPDAARVFGSLPLGSSDAELARVTIPGLAADLIAVNDAWKDGSLEHPERRWLSPLFGLLAVLAIAWIVRQRRRRRDA